jgi:hypothetical protein
MANPAIRDETSVPTLEQRADEIRLASFAEGLTKALTESGWLQLTKDKLKQDIPIVKMWDIAHGLTTAANNIFEQQLMQNGVDVKASSNYYATPILPAWSKDNPPDNAERFLSEFRTLLVDELQLTKYYSLAVPANREDAIGSTRELFSSVFWEEIQCLRLRQDGANWKANNRLIDYLHNIRDEERRRVTTICSISGHNIHGLRAKDTSKRWAYYFVHVESAREQVFLDAIKGDVDLENFGTVIGSEYEYAFRQRQSDRAAAYYRARLAAYANFAEKHKIYSLPPAAVSRKDDHAIRDKRLAKAMIDEGSREALADHLTYTDTYDPASEAAGTEELVFTEVVPVGIQNEAAQIVLTFLLERSSGIAQLRKFCRLLTAPEVFDLQEELGPVRRAVSVFGGNARAFEIFDLLFVSNASLNTKERMASALAALADFSFVGSHWLPTMAARLLKPFKAEARRRAQADIENQFSELEIKSATLDFLYRLSGPRRRSLNSAVAAYCLAPEGSFDTLQSIVVSICRQHQKSRTMIYWLEAIRLAGVRVERNLAGRFTELALSSDDQGRKLLFLLNEELILEVQSLALLGNVIEEKSPVEKRELVQSLLSEAVEKACEVTGYPVEARPALVARIAEGLLQHDRNADGSWVSKVTAEAKPAPLLTRIALPDKAPAIWRDDKQPGETPPTFIKRHYGPWLRADATGLTRPDLKRLDRSLYVAVANWLQKNTLPSDCPIPQRSERVDAEIKAFGHQNIDSNAVFRIRSAQQRRQK